MSVSAGEPEQATPDVADAVAPATADVADPVEEATGVPADKLPRDAAHWATKVSRLQSGARTGARTDNVSGRRLMGPVQGFGKMWQKTYTVDFGPDVTPQRAIATWKADFGSFWPKGNRFHGALTGIAPGVADDESFTLMTPQGHMFAGWITNSAFERDGTTIVQAQVLMRANDPLYELGMGLGGHRQEDKFWHQTIELLATHLGAPGREYTTSLVCVDKHRQWGRAGNIWHNAAIRTMLQMLLAPVRAVTRRRGPTSDTARR